MPQPHDAATAVQLLCPDGTLQPHPDYAVTLDADTVAAMYRDMVLVRRVDTEAIALQRQGELGLWTSLRGQEAAQIGAAHALRDHDMVFPSYREHGIAWCRGLDPLELLPVWRGSNAGGWNPSAHNFANYTIVIGAQTLHAVGYAMGVVRDGAVATGDPQLDTAVLVCFGDGAMSQGDVNEAFAWASAQQLPVVFFCQNNQWAISAPVHVQSTTPLFRRAAGFGFPGIQVDGNDVLATYEITRAALDRARSGQGPTLIEAYTYRMNPHTTSDDATRYRAASELADWQRRDPIERTHAYLLAAGVGAAFFDALAAEAEDVATKLRSGARTLPDITAAELFGNVAVSTDADLEGQRADFAAYHESA